MNIIRIPYKKITKIHVFINAGSIVEKENELGLSHLLEHILMEAWASCTDEFKDILSKINCVKYWSDKGVFMNAGTETSIVHYYISSLNKYAELMTKFMFDIMTKPHITDEMITKSKKAVEEELLGFIDDPYNKIYDSLYKRFPDIKNLCNWQKKLELLKTFTKNDIISFHGKWYTNDNMVFIVLGSEFGPNNITFLKKDVKIRKPDIKEKTIINKNASKAIILVSYLCPIIEEYLFYTDFIRDFLCGDISSYLMVHLRDKLGLVYSVSLNYEYLNSFYLSTFEISCTDENINEVKKEFLKLMTNLNFSNTIFKRTKERCYYQEHEMMKNVNYLSSFYGYQYIHNFKKIVNHKDCTKMIKSLSEDKFIEIFNGLFNEYAIDIQRTK